MDKQEDPRVPQSADTRVKYALSLYQDSQIFDVRPQELMFHEVLLIRLVESQIARLKKKKTEELE